jgi:hypothetical protein
MVYMVIMMIYYNFKQDIIILTAGVMIYHLNKAIITSINTH